MTAERGLLPTSRGLMHDLPKFRFETAAIARTSCGAIRPPDGLCDVLKSAAGSDAMAFLALSSGPAAFP